MRHATIITIIWFALVLSARASMDEISITPNNLSNDKLEFSVTTNALNHGVAFHVTVSVKSDDILPHSDVHLWIVLHSGPGATEMSPAKPETRIVTKRSGHLFTADFVASRKLLKTNGACFVFAVYGAFNNGKWVAMPHGDFYELKLQDFAKP